MQSSVLMQSSPCTDHQNPYSVRWCKMRGALNLGPVQCRPEELRFLLGLIILIYVIAYFICLVVFDVPLQFFNSKFSLQ